MCSVLSQMAGRLSLEGSHFGIDISGKTDFKAQIFMSILKVIY